MQGPWAIPNDPRLGRRQGDEDAAPWTEEYEAWLADQRRLTDEDKRYERGGSAER